MHFWEMCVKMTDRLSCDVCLVGRSYVVLVTASVFNLVAMTCSESYAYNHSIRELELPTSSSSSSLPSSAAASHGNYVGCTMFGVLTVDACSLLTHLGPTIIGGGDFYHRAAVTTVPCIPVHAAVKVS